MEGLAARLTSHLGASTSKPSWHTSSAASVRRGAGFGPGHRRCCSVAPASAAGTASSGQGSSGSTPNNLAEEITATWVPPRLQQRPELKGGPSQQQGAAAAALDLLSPAAAAAAADAATAAALPPRLARAAARANARREARALADVILSELQRSNGACELFAAGPDAGIALEAAAAAATALQRRARGRRALEFEVCFADDAPPSSQQPNGALQQLGTSADNSSGERTAAFDGSGSGGGSGLVLSLRLCPAARRVDALVQKTGAVPTDAWRRQEAAGGDPSEAALQLAASLATALESDWGEEEEEGEGSAVVYLALMRSQLPAVLPALALLRRTQQEVDSLDGSSGGSGAHVPVCIVREAPPQREASAARGVAVILEVALAPTAIGSQSGSSQLL